MLNIQEYNNKLANELIKINLIEYFKYIHNTYYKYIDTRITKNYFFLLCGYSWIIS